MLSGETVAQQRTQYTQYMFNGLVINPAYAGADEALSVTFVNRNQWIGIDGAPQTQTLVAHTLFKKKQVGVGMTISNDRIGVHKNLNVLTNYAYHLKTGNASFLSFGLQAGLHNRQADYASLFGEGQGDPKLYDAYISHTFFDFGFGLYFRAKRLHIGYSIPELIPEKLKFNDSLTVKLNSLNHFLFSKYTIPLNENLDIEPGLLVKYLYGVPLSFDLNMNFIYRKVLTAGLSYRKSESVDFLFKGQVTPQLQIGYSYDYPVGAVSMLSNASHEVMINYLFKYRQTNTPSPR